MATDRILEFFRTEDPRFEGVSDEKLIHFVGSTKKSFLQDEEFKRDFQNILRGQMQELQSPEGRQRVASEAQVDDLSTLDKGMLSFISGSKMLASNLALAGARTADRARRSSFGGFLARTPGVGDLLEAATIAAPEKVAEVTSRQAETFREVRDILPPTKLQSVVNAVAEAAPSIGPSLVAGPFGGLPATVGAAAITSYGSVLADAEKELRDRGYSESEVRQSAHAEGIIAGVATGLITGGFNKFAPGLEKLAANAFRKPAQVITKDGKTVGQFKSYVVDVLKGFGSEASEEALDETAQSMLEMYVRDPNMEATEVVKRALIAGGIGGILGGGFAAVAPRGQETPQEDQPPVSEETVDEGISNVEDVEARPIESLPVEPAAEPVVTPEEVITPEQKELAAQSIALEQEFAEASTELESVSQQAGALENMLQESDPESFKTMAADMKMEEEVLKSKVEDLRAKRTAAIEARQAISAAQLKAVEPEMTQTADLTLEEDLKPETHSIVSLGAVAGPMTPWFGRTKDSLTFDPTELVKTWPGKAIVYSRRGLVGHSAPTEFSEKALTSQAKKSSFVKLAKGYAEELDRLIKADAKKSKPRATRLLAASNAFLSGKQIEDGILTPGMMEVLTNARKLIDSLSQRVLDLGLVDGSLAKTIRDNIGNYLTRTYKVYDKIYDWTYDTVPQSVKTEASNYIQKTQKVDAKKADEIIRDILDPRVATEWLLGKTNVGGIPVSSFLKRNDIPVEIRRLMGEIKNPLENMMKTTNTLASIVTAFELQEQIATMGLKGGVFKTEPTGEMRHLVFGGRKGVDPRLAKKYPSLANLYATKEMSDAMQRFYGSNVGPESMLDLFVWKPLRKITSFGKFNQVILNLTDAFPVNLTGAFMVELMNGRVLRRPGLAIRSLFGLATRRFRRDRGEGKPPNISKIEDALNLTGADFKKGWNSFIKDLDLVEAMAERFGAVEDNVIVRDILEGWASNDQLEGLRKLNSRSIKRLPTWLKNKVFSPLGNIYAYPDNAMKVNAFMDEALTYANAYPERSMEQIFKTAADITRATTPVYSKVPKGLRELNLVGVIPTYISFTYEMFRNTFNTVSIGMQEMKSSNPLIRARGANRTVSAMGILGVAAFAAQGLADFFREMFTDSDELGEERRKDLNWLLAPWDRFQQNGILNYKHGKEFTYANLSYQIPQAVVTAPVTAALESRNPDEAFKNFASTSFETFFGGSILAGSIGSVLFNKKAGGGEIYNDQLEFFDKADSSVRYISKNVFMPGFWRKWERMQKASEDSGGSYGRLYSTTEETVRLFGIRPNTYNIPEASRFRMADFAKTYRTASRIISDIRAKSLPPAEAKKKLDQEQAAQTRIIKDYTDFINAMLRLGVSKKTLRKNQTDIFKAERGETASSVPKDLRDAVKSLLR